MSLSSKKPTILASDDDGGQGHGNLALVFSGSLLGKLFRLMVAVFFLILASVEQIIQ
jgi:hypothetical protein